MRTRSCSPGEPVYNEVVRHFGGGILNPDLSVNRAKLAELAFGPPDAPADSRASRIEELNRIVHPAVIRSQDEWMEQMGIQDRNAVAIVEAALILEAGAGDRFDRLMVVTCNAEQRAARFAARQKIDWKPPAKKSRAAWPHNCPDEEKIKAADYVIDNSGLLEQPASKCSKSGKNSAPEQRFRSSNSAGSIAENSIWYADPSAA